MIDGVNKLFLGGALFFGGLAIAVMEFNIGIGVSVFGVGLMVAHFVLLRKDPYSLDALRRVEEREEVRRLRESIGRHTGESAVCPACMEVYDVELGVCPNCNQLGKR